MKIETEQICKLVKKYGGVLTDDRHFMDDVDKLLETAHNSDYTKCPNCGSSDGTYSMGERCISCHEEI